MDTSVKDKILEAANKIIAEKNLNHFTLDQVAKEAGVSKGGLLYYYPNKEKLIKGLIENYLDLFDSSVSEREQALSEASPNNWLVSYIQEQFYESRLGSNAMYGILAAVGSSQDLLKPILKKRKEWLEKINASKDPILGTIISFACDGIVFSNLLGLETFPEDTKTKIMERLINLTKECY